MKTVISIQWLLLTIYLCTINEQTLVQGRPLVFAIPLLTVEKIKNWFSSLTGSGLQSPPHYPPSINRILDSCNKAFTSEGELITPIPSPEVDEQNQLAIDLSESYFLYSSENQTLIFNHIFNKIKASHAPCPVEPSICGFLPSIVTKDAPFNYIIYNLLDSFWESCVVQLDNLTNSVTLNDSTKKEH